MGVRSAVSTVGPASLALINGAPEPVAQFGVPGVAEQAPHLAFAGPNDVPCWDQLPAPWIAMGRAPARERSQKPTAVT
jgi:hypothetical protein